MQSIGLLSGPRDPAYLKDLFIDTSRYTKFFELRFPLPRYLNPRDGRYEYLFLDEEEQSLLYTGKNIEIFIFRLGNG